MARGHSKVRGVNIPGAYNCILRGETSQSIRARHGETLGTAKHTRHSSTRIGGWKDLLSPGYTDRARILEHWTHHRQLHCMLPYLDRSSLYQLAHARLVTG